ncbi:MAG: hypothetical protein J3K34DRAFT_20653 [Monoraphidium minutum]|nr:MAG: hypothetical protein J3K34DRAFT_20653 [Monoraphidium minutum]
MSEGHAAHLAPALRLTEHPYFPFSPNVLVWDEEEGATPDGLAAGDGLDGGGADALAPAPATPVAAVPALLVGGGAPPPWSMGALRAAQASLEGRQLAAPAVVLTERDMEQRIAECLILRGLAAAGGEGGALSAPPLNDARIRALLRSQARGCALAGTLGAAAAPRAAPRDVTFVLPGPKSSKLAHVGVLRAPHPLHIFSISRATWRKRPKRGAAAGGAGAARGAGGDAGGTGGAGGDASEDLHMRQFGVVLSPHKDLPDIVKPPKINGKRAAAEPDAAAAAAAEAAAAAAAARAAAALGAPPQGFMLWEGQPAWIGGAFLYCFHAGARPPPANSRKCAPRDGDPSVADEKRRAAEYVGCLREEAAAVAAAAAAAAPPQQ